MTFIIKVIFFSQWFSYEKLLNILYMCVYDLLDYNTN